MILCLFAALTCASLVYLMFPHAEGDPVRREDYERRTYLKLLKEIDEDRGRGEATERETTLARLEIERRILKTAVETKTTPRPISPRTLFVLLVILLPIPAGLLEAKLGQPSLKDQPYKGRSQDPDIRLDRAARKLTLQLAQNPDPKGYKLLAGIDYALHRYPASLEASARAHQLGADDASLWSQSGESRVMQNEGIVVVEAMTDFKRALERDPQDARAKFYLGQAESQIGNLKKAVAVWRDIERSAPADAPWKQAVDDAIAQAAKDGSFDPQTVKPAPPDLDRLPVK